MMPRFKILHLDVALVGILILLLITHYLNLIPPALDSLFLMIASVLATLPILWRAILSLKNKRLSIDLLAGTALVVSLIAQEWTSAVFINLMLASARIFANYTETRAKNAIASLLKLKPKTATVEKNGQHVKIPLNEVKKGDWVIVGLGEQIPVDGTVQKGEASLDQSSLTGESIPVAKTIGDLVLSPAIVVEGNLVIKAEKIGQETTLEKIIDLVEKSQAAKAPIQTISEKFTTWYIAITILGSVVLYVFSGNLDLVLSVLLVTCADDIAIAIPLAFLAAISYAAKRGIIIKGSNFLEALTKLKILVVDKTGTLTRGQLKVEEYLTFNDFTPDEALQLAGAVSLLSAHPSAKAILKYVRENHIVPSEPEHFDEYPGKGGVASWQNKKIVFGKPSFFEEQKIAITPEQLAEIEKFKEKGLNISLIAQDGRLACFMALADHLRPQSKEAISQLKNLGIEKIIMLTGDNERIAKRVAESVGISEFHANLLPEDKLSYLKKYLSKEYKVAMVGDGVNDAAALALADIGIAMGAIGSDVAIETADIALMKDDLSKLPEIIKLSQFTSRVARQNFWIWGILNGAGLALVFGGYWFGILMPAAAAAYNFITDFVPLINSMRLFRLHLKKR